MKEAEENVLRKPKTEFSVVGNEAIISHHFSNAVVRELSINKEKYALVHIKGYGYEIEPGQPQMPGYTDIIPLIDKKTDLNVSTRGYVEYRGLKIIPAQKRALNNNEGNYGFILNDSVYKKNEFFPQNIVSIQDIQDYRGHKYAFVRVNPVQYNPVTGVIRCYQDIQYTIGGVNTELLPAVNRDLYSPVVSTKQEKYIIVTSNNYLSSIADFIKWKEDLGYHVSVLTKNQWINDNEVRDSIRSEYYRDSTIYDPRFLLLIGSYSAVPAKKIMSNNLYREPHFLTDHYFSCVGDSSDYLADLARGRIPLTNADSIKKYLEFIMHKEKNPSFWGKGIHSAFFNQLKDSVTEDLNCVCFSEETRKYMKKHAFQIDRVYKKKSYTTPLKYNSTYANGDSVPTELRVENFAWNGSANGIINAMREGCDYVMYKGHGDGNGLEQIGFNSTTVLNINDNICSPLFLCFACLCGQYATINNSGQVVNELNNFTVRLMQQKKSCGVIASSSNCFAPYVEPFGEGLFSCLFRDSILSPEMHMPPHFNYTQIQGINYTPQTEIGNIMNFGFTQLLTSMGARQGAIDELTHFHVFGDPSFHFPINSPIDLNEVSISRINDSIYIHTNGIDSCCVILEKKNNNGDVISYKRLENVTGEYSFYDVTEYNKIIIKKNNCKTIFLNGFSFVYLQNKDFLAEKTYVGKQIIAGRNITNKTQVGDVVVKNGGTLNLRHSNMTIMEKGIKVEPGGKLTIKKQ